MDGFSAVAVIRSLHEVDHMPPQARDGVRTIRTDDAALISCASPASALDGVASCVQSIK